MSQLNVAVIGVGSISQHHLKAYRNNPNVRIYAVCDLNEERAKGKAAEYGAEKVYTDYRELLTDPQVDAVSICTWNNTHAPISIAALEAGKHVLVEKPPAMTVEEALRMQDAVSRTGNILQIGFVRRYDANAQLLKGLVESGEFGELYYAKASAIRRLGNPGGWFADIERSGGGPLIDIGVHMIDLLWYMMGKPKPVTVSGNTYRKLGNRSHIRNLAFYQAADYDPTLNTVEDMANALIRFENGASLQVDVSFTLHAKEDGSMSRLYGAKGGFEIDPSVVIVTEKHNTIMNMTPQVNHAGFHFESAFQNEIDHFVDCVRNNKQPLSPIADGVEMMRMLRGVYDSAAQATEVRL